MDRLFGFRVRANEAMAEHPTVQVGDDGEGGWTVGVLGILNGIFGVDADDWGFISAVVENADGELVRFAETKRH